MSRQTFKVLTVAAFLLAPALALAGYGEGGYYGGEGGYYSQSYYQTYYQGSYTAQDIVNMRSTNDQCGQYYTYNPHPGSHTCNSFVEPTNDTTGNFLDPATAGAFVFRATTGANSFALSSFCRAWGKWYNTAWPWQPQTCANGPSGGSLPASIPAGTGVTLEFWNRSHANIGYYNGCNNFCGDRMDWYLQNWLPNCSTNFGASSQILTTIMGQTAQGYGTATVFPLVTTTYTVNCSGGDPGALSRSITVTVTPTATVTFSVSTPANYNTASTVNWSSTNAHSCSLSGGSFGAGLSVATSGVGGSTGPQTAPSINYTFSCLRDSDNTVISQVQTVSVDQCLNIAGTQAAPPANGAMAGGTCTCNSGYTGPDGSGNCNADPVVVSITAPDNAAYESTADTGTLRLTRTGPTTSSLNVTMSLTSGGGFATNGTDFTSVTSPITINAGSATKDITITPVADGVTEGTEIVRMTISNGAGYTVSAPASADVTIFDAPAGTITGGAANGLQVVCAVGQAAANSCRIRSGGQATLSWNVSNMTSCGVTGSDSTTPAANNGTNGSNGAHSVQSSAVNQVVVYTLLCTDGVGTQSTAQARVTLIPKVEER